jgi:flagellar hook-basal body complex protein FliE
MNDFNTMLIRGGDLLPPSLQGQKPAAGVPTEAKPFTDVLKDAIADINKLQVNADEAIGKVELGNAASIHEAMIALEKAGLSFRAMMQVRNKIMDAYQEIMRIQV